MRINHNIAALNTYNKLSANTSATSKSLEKLSSGLKINRAGDNAAGLAISEKMRGQISGLNTASTNANDSISLIQTAEGALNETHSILQRMRELAVQSSNDTNTDADRGEIQKEINQLTKEIDRISNDTEFNTQKLLNGDKAIKTTEAVSGLSSGGISVEAGVAGGTYHVKTTVTAAAISSFQSTGTGAGSFSGITSGRISTTDLAKGTYTITVDTASNTASLADVDGRLVASIDTSKTKVIEGVNISGNTSVNGTLSFTVGTAKKETIAVTDAANKAVTGINIDLDYNAISASGDVVVDASNVLTFQIGANTGQSTTLGIDNMSAKELGVNDLDLTKQASANSAITTIDNAIANVSSQRAKLGAVQNRLEHTINNLGTSAENLTSAESRIRDVDMAKEMMEFTKNNILSQAAQSMLAQANQQPQSVLQLLQ
ncbi:flagellin N-terminal helical domain-containing protein [Acetobacterium woodii]|uniref:Flagellin n=1 Tax=Acetobacterium woodii (strain ATCC 29683 / DSM 1030 / JCM 2381 / KCTC 1655 / WB1) TaxID=931626 RepID=H6LDT5_ACEWD|nr:flagellin [Acetobacterium woodii]AFA49249.1 flagellin [Acetobacterium woodii DSM 1030]